MLSFSKRIFLFLAVNILVLLTLSISFNIICAIFGIEFPDQLPLFVFYGFFGMGGAFLSLLMSRMAAKWSLGVRVLDPASREPVEKQLIEIVYTLAQKAGLNKMPEVGIYESPEVNAFATGPTKNRSLVAVSTGLLNRMSRDQVEGVLGHELSHVTNGDMVTMTLIQGVINTLVLILARLIASAVANSFEERSRPAMRMLLYYMLQIMLSILGSVVVNYFSRWREFRADAGGARLAGREKMLGALHALSGVYGEVDTAHQALATLKISGRSQRMVSLLFSTHPPLDERIRRLERMPD